MLPLRFKLSQFIGQATGRLSQLLGLGNGSVIPARLGLIIEPNILAIASKAVRHGIILVTGTNGKSTTTYYLTHVLRSLGYSVLTNPDGANLYSGIATACLKLKQPVDYAVLEVDEASLNRVAAELQPQYVIALNLSRDQMDRYSEIESLVKSMVRALECRMTTLLYNTRSAYTAVVGDSVAGSIGYAVKLDTPTSLDIPICHHCQQSVLTYGEGALVVNCQSCGWRSRSPQLISQFDDGLLRILNRAIGCPSTELAETLTATVLACLKLGLPEEKIIQGLERTPPLPAHAMRYNLTGHSTLELILAKNPASFQRLLNQSDYCRYTDIVLAINRQPADGLDTSWLWDVDFEALSKLRSKIVASGQAAQDVRLRLLVQGIAQVGVRAIESLASELSNPQRQWLVIANYTAYQQAKLMLANTIEADANSPKQVVELEYI